MKRKEFIEKWGTNMGNGFTPEELSADLDSLLPSAESAEEIIRKKLNLGKTFNASQYPREIFAIEVGEMLEMMQEFAALTAGKMVEERTKMLTEKCKKLEFMIENGLGWKDMENDITMPHEL